MRKIISLFRRDYDGDRQVIPEVVPGAEWVLAGEGVPTIKWDGTCCQVKGVRLYRRYDRKLTQSSAKRQRKGQRPEGGWLPEHCRRAPEGWDPAQAAPDPVTGHWPGWLAIGDGPGDRWHREAALPGEDGTYELVGPKIQGNPYGYGHHLLVRHGASAWRGMDLPEDVDGAFAEIRRQFRMNPECEGIVWHHPDGRMAKIKRKDFGLPWPALDESD